MVVSATCVCGRERERERCVSDLSLKRSRHARPSPSFAGEVGVAGTTPRPATLGPGCGSFCYQRHLPRGVREFRRPHNTRGAGQSGACVCRDGQVTRAKDGGRRTSPAGMSCRPRGGQRGGRGQPRGPAGLQGPREASGQPERGGACAHASCGSASRPRPGSSGVLVSPASPTHPPWWPRAPWDVTGQPPRLAPGPDAWGHLPQGRDECPSRSRADFGTR